MDKNAIKKFAIWARRELIERVSQRAMIYGINAEEAGDPNAVSVNSHLLSAVEKRQRQALIQNIKEKGYEQVMEEVAYTWFNRFAALRFMEVNGYLPSHIRVFTNDAGEFKPQILAEAIHLELDGLDMNQVYELENANKSEELFKYLLIVQCNALNRFLPGMFQRIEDYTELLLPDYLLREGSVIEQMVAVIPEEDWMDQVQIIGWLYQYYNTEPKESAFSKKGKLTKDEVPAATQLFTPDWIVHYMVENSLGRLWLNGHPNERLQKDWQYYLEEAPQELEVQNQLAVIQKDYSSLKPEEIRVIDPCCGSGHILLVVIDVLIGIYESYGYSSRDAIVNIVNNNIWGIDVDDRATQLTYFSVMMKALQYNRRFLYLDVNPHIYSILESNQIDSQVIHSFCGNHLELRESIERIVASLKDAKEYGSAITTPKVDYGALRNRFKEIQNDETLSLYSETIQSDLRTMVEIAESLSQQYHVVLTNPPYMKKANMSPKLDAFVKKYYDSSKADMYSVFIEKCYSLTKSNCFQGMITQHTWMFLSSYEKLRNKLQNATIINMVHLGAHAFEDISGEVVQTTSFILQKAKCKDYKGSYSRLVDASSPLTKEKQYLNAENRYVINAANFKKLPGEIIGYQLSPTVFDIFEKADSLAVKGEARQGLGTSDNNRFLRLWFEVAWDTIGFGLSSTEETNKVQKKWFPYIKGGAFRRWYPLHDYLVNYKNDGYEIKASVMKKYPYLQSPDFVVKNTNMYFHSGITWSDVATGLFSARRVDEGYIFADAGPMFFPKEDSNLYLGYFNSPVFQMFGDLICQGMHYSTGHIPKIPYIVPEGSERLINALVDDCVELSRLDCDSFETSWSFKRHPLLNAISNNKVLFDENDSVRLEDCYLCWKSECDERFERLKANEEKLNKVFISLYGLEEELISQVEDDAVTVRRADLMRDIKSLISFAVGCMFGRYSLDEPGLICAGNNWGLSTYSTYKPDLDAIIPICDDDYFEDDIVSRFIEFIRVVFGTASVDENLRYIADALGGKGSPREIIRNYFINDFYADHCSVYSVPGSGKRPIYWLFDSGKKNGFKCLIYMHRYQPDTIARIRTDYVHEQQSRYRTAIADMEQRITNASGAERVKLTKQLTKLQGQAEEVRVYEEKIHHLADQMIEINLDDGVKYNYALFKDVLAKIK